MNLTTLELQWIDPLCRDVPDETCQACGSDLGDAVYRVQIDEFDPVSTLGACCITPAERCDACGFWRCCCE